MKTLILSVTFLLTAVNTFAQGTVNFVNVGPGLSAPVFDIDGTTALGPAFLAQLFVGNSSSENSLSAVPDTAAFIGSGFFVGGIRTLPGFAPGSKPFFQVRVWAAAGGASYEAALAAGAKAGKSPVFQIGEPLGDPFASPPTVPAKLIGLRSFALIPKPSIADFKLIAGTFTASVSSLDSLNYVLEYKDSLTDTEWTVAQILPGTGAQLTFSDAAATNRTRFYRVRTQ